jgi:hypothetical protein
METTGPAKRTTILGMTPLQAAVLAVLAVVSCGVFAAGAVMFVADRAPRATAQPTPTPIPGWEKIEGSGASLWMPESFAGGNLEEDLELIIEDMKSLGPTYELAAQNIKQNRSAFALWAFDARLGPSGFLTNVNVTREKVPSAVTVETYMDAATAQLPADFHVLSRELVSLGSYEAGRLTTEFSVSGPKGSQLIYIIKNGSRVYAITYSTGADEFQRRLPVFEQSARTFVVEP